MTIRVLIADDQAMVRAGFAMVLAAEDDIDVVAEAADGLQAVELAERHRPDVVLMDIRMPRLDGLDGLEALRHLTRPGIVNPPKVVVATTFDDDEYVHRALHDSACGFLIKDSGPALLVEAIRAAASGEALVSPSITMRLLRSLNSAATTRRTAHSALSARELDLVRLVARGRTNAEIATELSISVGTVKTHLGNVQTKLPARNRVEIAAWAWETGLADRQRPRTARLRSVSSSIPSETMSTARPPRTKWRGGSRRRGADPFGVVPHQGDIGTAVGAEIDLVADPVQDSAPGHDACDEFGRSVPQPLRVAGVERPRGDSATEHDGLGAQDRGLVAVLEVAAADALDQG